MGSLFKSRIDHLSPELWTAADFYFKKFWRYLVLFVTKTKQPSCWILFSSYRCIPSVIWKTLKRTSFLANLFCSFYFLRTSAGFRALFFIHLCIELLFNFDTSSFWFFFFFDCCLFRLKCHKSSLTSRPVSTKCWMMFFSHSCALITAPIYEPAVEPNTSCGVWQLSARHSLELELLPNAPLGYHWRKSPINASPWVFCAAGRGGYVFQSNWFLLALIYFLKLFRPN